VWPEGDIAQRSGPYMVTEQESIKGKEGKKIRDCSFGDIHGCIKYLPYERVCTMRGSKQIPVIMCSILYLGWIFGKSCRECRISV
jgi:hypothetical protein